MKRIITIMGILILAGALIFPLMAFSYGRGGGHYMMGYWGNSTEYGRCYYRNLTPEQETELEALDRKFYDETRGLRDSIRTKSSELEVVLGNSNPDIEKAKGLQKEISDLRAALDEKTVTYELEARKIVPDQNPGYGNRGWNGHHMGSFGTMMGYGHGY